MTVLASLLRGQSERAITSSEFWGRWVRGDDVPTNMSLAGVAVTRESAMQLQAVWSCVGLIADSISTMPLDVFTRFDGARRPFRPRPPWLDEPNPEQDRNQLVAQQLVSLLLDGKAYVYTPRDRVGDVIELWNAPAWMVTPRRVRGGLVYEVNDPERGSLVLDQTQMFHVSGISWPGEITGISPLEAAKHMIGSGLGAQEFAERFYGQGFSAAGIVETDSDLSPEQAKDLKEDFSRMAGGLRKSHLPAVLTNGAKWKPTTVTPEQAQFLETRGFTRSEIAGFFRVPPHLIGDVDKSTSWGTGIEQQAIGFVTYTLRPWIERLEQAYSRRILNIGRQQRAFTKFNVNGLLRGDFKTRMEGYAIGVNNGFMAGDEIRSLEDMPPLPEGLGQKYYVQGALRPVDEPFNPNTTAPEGGTANE